MGVNRKNFESNAAKLTKREIVRFWKMPHRAPKSKGGCWLWPDTGDYGLFTVRGMTFPAHQLSFFLKRGSIPTGRMVCHHCNARPCINPVHLYSGSSSENATDIEIENELFRPSHRLQIVTARLFADDVEALWELSRQKRTKWNIELRHLVHRALGESKRIAAGGIIR